MLLCYAGYICWFVNCACYVMLDICWIVNCAYINVMLVCKLCIFECYVILDICCFLNCAYISVMLCAVCCSFHTFLHQLYCFKLFAYICTTPPNWTNAPTFFSWSLTQLVKRNVFLPGLFLFFFTLSDLGEDRFINNQGFWFSHA